MTVSTSKQRAAALERPHNHLAPNHLMVLVALFRYYVYQQRFLEALTISQQARAVIRQPLDWPHDWRSLSAAARCRWGGRADD